MEGKLNSKYRVEKFSVDSPKYYVQQFNVESPSIQEGINHQFEKGYKPIFFQVYVERSQLADSQHQAHFIEAGFLLVIFERESNEKKGGK